MSDANYVEDFISAGFSKQKAQTLANALHNANRGIVTKDYLDKSFEAFEQRFETHEARIDAKIWRMAFLIVGATISGIILAAQYGLLTVAEAAAK